MTQASLSPDLNGALGATPSVPYRGRSGASSETALWIIALTSAALVVASVLLLGLLVRNAIRDASLGGFVTGIAVMIAALGIGALAYVLVTARRQGLLHSDDAAESSPVSPSGMHVVPARPAELGRRKRRELQTQREARSRQAKAIATATTITPRRSPVVTQRPAAPPPPTPRPMPVRRPTPPRAPARTAPAAPRRVAPAPPPLVTRPAPMRRPLVAHPQARPVIHMPRANVRRARPGAWPTAPVARMVAPRPMPRTQAALFQVNAANVRAAAPVQPH